MIGIISFFTPMLSLSHYPTTIMLDDDDEYVKKPVQVSSRQNCGSFFESCGFSNKRILMVTADGNTENSFIYANSAAE